MNVLVTGGAGTLGQNIIKHFSHRFGAIHVVDNFVTSTRESLSNHKNVTIHEGSVADFSFLEKTFMESKPHLVFHLAASYKDPTDWSEDIDTNVHGMSNVVRLSIEQKVAKLVNVQTVLSYGRPKQIPISESAPYSPESSYAITKSAAEQILAMSGLPYLSLRLGNVISPGLAIGPIPTFYQRISEGIASSVTDSVRDFLDIRDFIDFLDIALFGKGAQGVFNVSSGVGVSILDIYRIIASLLKSELVPNLVEVDKDDIPTIVLDPSKACRELGWKAKVPLHESVEMCLESYRLRGGVGQIYSHLRGGQR